MKWYEKIIMKLDAYFSKDDQIIIKEQEKHINTLESDLELGEDQLIEYMETINDLSLENEELKNSLKSISSRTSKPTILRKRPTKYRMRPGWYDYLHKSLNNFSQDTEYLEKYTNFLLTLNLNNTYNDCDRLVYSVVSKAYAWLGDFPDDYNSDKEQFGTSEYWLTPQEAFNQYILGEASDCEDFSAFLWGCIISALILYGYEGEIHRLMRFDMKRPVGHAIVIWLNDKSEWKRIESTYYRRDFKSKWFDNSDVFKSVNTVMMTGHAFNEETEYIVD